MQNQPQCLVKTPGAETLLSTVCIFYISLIKKGYANLKIFNGRMLEYYEELLHNFHILVFLFDPIIRPSRLLSFSLPALDYCLRELQVMQITRVSNHDVIYNNPFFSQKSL